MTTKTSFILEELTAALTKYRDREERFGGKSPSPLDELAFIRTWARMRSDQLMDQGHDMSEHIQAARETGLHDDTR